MLPWLRSKIGTVTVAPIAQERELGALNGALSW